MGEIRKDNLHESLIEELNKLANIDLSGKQDKTDESLLTESKDVIGAINELFQSANNGKELIANAIGEPLNAEDTFSAMSSDINSLLSTFKTNMMNNGITVESGDKFKELIDKIKGLTEDEGNKGIQFAEGTCAVTNSLITHNCGFIPTYFFVLAGRISMQYKTSNGFYNSVLYNPVISNIRMFGSDTSIGISGSSSITELNESTAKISNISGDVTWYAIGVGEEDTTLKDSLASILTEEGVSVTEEDDMASLISKTDNQFNSLNTTITLLNNQVNSLTSELSGKVAPAGTAIAGDVLTGKTFINSTGQTITGTMANNGTKTITPKASAQSLGAGYYDKITINGDADLVAANIVSGKNIFGVTGTATVSSLGGKSITTGTATGTIYMYTGSNTYTYTLTFNNALTFTPSRFLLYIPKNANSSSPDSISLHNLVVDSVFHKTKEAYGYTCGICITNVTKTDVTITVRMINVNSRHTVTPTWSFIAIS